jgi:hypothetical protein
MYGSDFILVAKNEQAIKSVESEGQCPEAQQF